jgi:hypothetical protein
LTTRLPREKRPAALTSIMTDLLWDAGADMDLSVLLDNPI